MATSLLRLHSAPHRRGRVISLLVVAVAGATPVGGPLIGWVGEQWSARVAFVIGGVSTVLAVLGTWLYLARRSPVELSAEPLCPDPDPAEPGAEPLSPDASPAAAAGLAPAGSSPRDARLPE